MNRDVVQSTFPFKQTECAHWWIAPESSSAIRTRDSVMTCREIKLTNLIWFLSRIAFLFLSWVTSASAQESETVLVPRVAYDHTDDCKDCHLRVPTSHDFVADIPGSVWDKQDKHRDSFILLEKNKSLVTQILGFDWDEVFSNGQLSTKPEYKERVDRVKQCLRCHATWPKNDSAWSEDKTGPPVDLKFGVSCQACHGPGEAWSRPHRDKWWRLVTPAAKTQLGMTDVRHPVWRALLCASCHVGSLDDGKFVTHQMYAAGHPPLPGFEFAAFSSQMPVHWRSLKEKGDFLTRDQIPADFDNGQARWKNHGLSERDIKTSYREANYLGAKHDPFNDLAATQGVVVSGLVVMRDYVKLLQVGFAESNSRRTPEFALFDCAACHHELRAASGGTSRQSRGLPPGRPPLQAWQTTLARAGLWQSAKDEKDAQTLLEEFDKRWRAVELAAARRPFGDPVAIHSTAEELTSWLQPRIADISRRPFDHASAEKTWKFLTNPAQIATHDYHAARQTAWALSAMAKDAGRDIAADKLFFPNGKDQLKLRLPAKQTGNVILDLEDSLNAISNYDPAWFKSVLIKMNAQ